MKEGYSDRFPLNGTFELTARCNLKCKMCLVRIDDKRMAELGGRERTTEEWIQMAREALEAGTGALLLTGGEPLLRQDFIHIYKAIASMGFMLSLYTNATLVTDEIMEVFKEYPPHSIGVTVYGASPQTYEKVTGSAYAYNRMLEGVEKLRQLPSSLTIRTTIIKANLDDLDQMTQWAFGLGKNTGFNVSRIVTKPVRGGVSDVEDCRLIPEQSLDMIKKRVTRFTMDPLTCYLKEYSNESVYQILDKYFEPKTQCSSRTEKTLYGCSAGMTSFTITWDGKLIGCQLLGDCWTFPFEEGFYNAWERYPQVVKLPSLPNQCYECEIACTACPANRLAETGSLGGVPEYLCRESRLIHEMQAGMLEELKTIVNERKVINGKI